LSLVATAVASPALSLVALLVIQLPPDGERCRLRPGDVSTRELVLQSGVKLRIPDSWTETTEENLGVVRVRDERTRGCRLFFTFHDGPDTAERIRRVHERLYLGRNFLGSTCGEERLRTSTRRSEAAFGEYARDGRSRVYAMFWSTGATGFAALLTCPGGADGDWRVSLPLLSSIRRTSP
jgi:hypothetical protein